jgi:hypothetical protein
MTGWPKRKKKERCVWLEDKMVLWSNDSLWSKILDWMYINERCWWIECTSMKFRYFYSSWSVETGFSAVWSRPQLLQHQQHQSRVVSEILQKKIWIVHIFFWEKKFKFCFGYFNWQVDNNYLVVLKTVTVWYFY